MFEAVDEFMYRGLAEGVFPGAVLLACKSGTIVFFEAYGCANVFTGSPVIRDTVFDLASLTKPLATTLAVMALIKDHQIDLAQPVGSILPEFGAGAKADIQIAHLLYHTSGLPAYRPYYQGLNRLLPQEREPALHDALVHEPLENSVETKTVYSDLGFMVLEWVVARITGKGLDVWLQDNVYGPLGISDLFFNPLDLPIIERSYAATEKCPWRNILLEGRVHDDNAYALGGVAGHAGLFGTAQGVHRILQAITDGFHGKLKTNIFTRQILRRFLQKHPKSQRALGFDMPAAQGSSSGRFFSNHTVGHLGFTGTSFWLDLKRSIHVILLTNRVHPDRTNEKIRVFRPGLHDVVMKDLV